MTPWIIQQWRRDHPDQTRSRTDEEIALAIIAGDPSIIYESPELKLYAQQAARKKDIANGGPFDRQTVSKNYAKAADASTDRSWAEAFKDPFKRGALMAEQTELLTKLTSLSINKDLTEGNLREISDIHNKFKQFKPNVHMQEYAEAHGFMAKAGEFLGWKETPAIMYDLLASSMTGQALAGWDTISASTAAGAATGAAWGAAGGPAAPATSAAGGAGGAFYGFAVGMGKTSNDITQASTFIKELGDALGDDVMSDPDKLVREFANNKEASAKARKIAMKHGIPVGVIDGFTMGLAGKALGAGKKLAGMAKQTRKAAKFPKTSLLHTAARGGLLATEKTAAGVVPLGFESFMGATGEAIGQKFSKGKVYDWGDVFLEGVAEFGMAPLSITAAHLTRDKSPEVAKAVNDRIRDFRAKGMSSDDQKAQVDEDLNSKHYTPEEAEVLKGDIDSVYQAAVDPENPDGLTESERGAKQKLSKTEARKAILEYLGPTPTTPTAPASEAAPTQSELTERPEQRLAVSKDKATGEKWDKVVAQGDTEARNKMVSDGDVEVTDLPKGMSFRDFHKKSASEGKPVSYTNLIAETDAAVEKATLTKGDKILGEAGIAATKITLDDFHKLVKVSSFKGETKFFDTIQADLIAAEADHFVDGKMDWDGLFDAEVSGVSEEDQTPVNAFKDALKRKDKVDSGDTSVDEDVPFAQGQTEIDFDAAGTVTARFDQEVKIITEGNARKSEINEKNIADWKEINPRGSVEEAIKSGEIKVEPLKEVLTREQWDTKATSYKGKERGSATFTGKEAVAETEATVEQPARAEAFAIKKWREGNPDIQGEYSEAQVAAQLLSDSISSKKVSGKLTASELGPLYTLIPEQASTTVSEQLSPKQKLNRLLREESQLQAVISKAVRTTKQGVEDPNLAKVQEVLSSKQDQILALSEELNVDAKADPRDGHPLFDSDLHMELSTEDYGLFAEYKNPPFKYLDGSRKGEQMDTSLAETWRRTATKYAKNFRHRYGSESNDWAWEAFIKTLQKAQEVVSDMKEHGRDYMDYSATKNAYLKFAGGKVLKNAFFDLSRKAENRKRIEDAQASPSSAGHQKDNAAGWGFRTLDERAELAGTPVEGLGEELDEHSSRTTEGISNAVASGMAEGGVTGGLPERTPRAIAIRNRANRFIAKAVELVNKYFHERMGFDKKTSSSYEKWGSVELQRRITKDILAPHFVDALEHKNLVPKRLSVLHHRRHEINSELPRLEESLHNLNGKRFTKIIKAINSHIAKITVGKLYSEEAVQEMVSADIRAGVTPISAETIVTHRSQLEEEVIRLIENGILPKDSDAIIQIPSGSSTVGVSAKQLLIDIEARKVMLTRQLKRIEASITVINSEAKQIGSARGFPMDKIRNEIRSLYNEFNRERADVLDAAGNPLTQLNVPLISHARGRFSNAKLRQQYDYINSQAQQAVIDANITEDDFVKATDEREAYAKKGKGKTAEFRGDLLDKNTPLFDQLKGNFSVSYALDNLRTKLTGKAAKFAERMEPLTNLMAGLKTQTFLAEINEHRGDDRPAFYDFYHNRIVFDQRGMSHEKAFRTMMEEGLHALTSDKLANDPAFRKRVQGFLNKANRVRLADPDKYGHLNEYAFESVHEFIAHSLMDSDLQQFLSGIKSSVKDRGGIVDLYRSILDAIAKVLGLTPDEATLLEDVVFLASQAAHEKLTADPVKLRGVRVREKTFTINQRPDLYVYSENLSFSAWQPFQLDQASIDKRADPRTLTHDEVGEKLRALRASLGPKGIDAAFAAAFHGTPFTGKIEKFSTDFMGTGEGAQAFGWGLYFTTKKKIAEFYRDMKQRYSSLNTFYDGEKLDLTVLLNDLWDFDASAGRRSDKYKSFSDYLNANGYGPDHPFIKDFLKFADKERFTVLEFTSFETPAERADYNLEALREALAWVSDPVNKNQPSPDPATYGGVQVSTIDKFLNSNHRFEAKAASEGKLYEVELAPAEDEYLLLDEPYSKQSDKVKKGLEAIENEMGELLPMNLRTGKYIYKSLVGRFEPDVIEEMGLKKGDSGHMKAKREARKRASLLLRKHGIKGNKYLAGESRSKGEGNYNYVIFDDADIEITEAFAQGEATNYLETTLEFDKKLEGAVQIDGSLLISANEALELIANKSPSELARTLAKGLMEGTSPDVWIETVESIKNSGMPEAAGMYSQKLSGGAAGIKISKKAPSKVHAVLHEITHAKAFRSLAGVVERSMKRLDLEPNYPRDQRKWAETRLAEAGGSRAEMGAAELYLLFDRLSLRKDFGPHYGSANVDEMIAEAWSNPDFRKYLKGIKVSDLLTGKRHTGRTLRREGRIDNLWDSFKSSIAKFLGLNVEAADVLSRVMDASSEVMSVSENKRLDARTQPHSEFKDVFLAPDSSLQNVRDKQDLTKRTEGPTRASMSIYEKFKEKFVTKAQLLDSWTKRIFKEQNISKDLRTPLSGLHELLSGSAVAANAAVDNFMYDIHSLIGSSKKKVKQWDDYMMLMRIRERILNEADAKSSDRVKKLEEFIIRDGEGAGGWSGTADEQIELVTLLMSSKEVAPFHNVNDIPKLTEGVDELIAELDDPSMLRRAVDAEGNPIEEGGHPVFEGKFVDAQAKSQDHLGESLYEMYEAGIISLHSLNRMSLSTNFYVPFYVAKHFSGEDTFGQFITGIKEETQIAPASEAIKFKLYMTKHRVSRNLFMGKIDEFRREFDPDGKYIKIVSAKAFTGAPANWREVKFYNKGVMNYLVMEADIADLMGHFNPISSTQTYAVMKAAGDIFKLGATGINVFFQAGNFLLFDPIRLLTTSKAGLRAKEKGLNPIILAHQYIKAIGAASWRNLAPHSIKNLIRPIAPNVTEGLDSLYQEFVDSGAAGSTIAEYFDKARAIPDPVGSHKGIHRNPSKIEDGIVAVNASLSAIGKTLEQTAKMVGMQRMNVFEGIDELQAEIDSARSVEDQMRLKQEMRNRRDAIAVEIRNYAGSPDFMRKGTVTESEALNVVFMFFNARIQGVERDMSRMAKVFSKSKGDRATAMATIMKLSAFAAAPTMMAWAMNRRLEDDYDEISDEEKKRYFMIPLESRFEHPYIEGKMLRDYIRIPRRESFGLFSYTLEKGLDAMYKEDPKAIAEMVGYWVESMSPVNLDGLTEGDPVKMAESMASSMNPMIKGTFEQVGNRNFFRHKPLIPPSLEKADPSEQFYETTPEVYKWLGSNTGLGALRVKHLADSLTAGGISQFMPPKDIGREGFASTPLLHRLSRSSYVEESDISEILNDADAVDATGRVIRRRMADKFMLDTRGMSIQERVRNIPPPKNQNEKLLKDLIIRRLRQQALGLDPDEIRMKNSTVNVRASVILSQIEDMTPAEVKVYLTDLAQKRILTKDTIIQVNQRLSDRGVTLRDYVQ